MLIKLMILLKISKILMTADEEEDDGDIIEENNDENYVFIINI